MDRYGMVRVIYENITEKKLVEIFIRESRDTLRGVLKESHEVRGTYF